MRFNQRTDAVEFETMERVFGINAHEAKGKIQLRNNKGSIVFIYLQENLQMGMENESNHFNVRVYGLVRNDLGQLLVTDEYCQNRFMTKFPGGGLEPGEGLIDGLKREFMEECHEDIEVLQHFYTTDFYVKSMFRGGGQLISVYYECRFKNKPRFESILAPFEGMQEINDSVAFRWISLNELNIEHLTWPIDKYVVGEYLKRWRMV